MNCTTLFTSEQGTPDLATAPRFLRELNFLADPNDEQSGVLIRRVECDILELIIRKKRAELGVANG